MDLGRWSLDIQLFYISMKSFIQIIFIVFLLSSGLAHAAYFPDPTPTAEWDLIGGQIFGGAFPIGSEIAAWDAGGTLRFRATIDTLANYYGLAAFYGPPDGSTDPHDFTWKIFDGSTVYLATVHDEGTTWANYIGGTPGGTFIINFDRGDPQGVVPEPASFLIFGLIAGSGIFAGMRKRKRK